MSLSPMIVTSRAAISSCASRLSTRSFCDSSAWRSSGISLPGRAMTSLTCATGVPCTMMSSSPMTMTTVSFAFSSAIDSGSWMSLAFGNTSTSEELTSRKNTRIVKMSISDTRFSVAPALLRLWWLSMRAARRDLTMA